MTTPAQAVIKHNVESPLASAPGPHSMSPSKVILAINAGSSSVKLSLYTTGSDTASSPKLLIESSISNLTSPPALFTYTHSSSSSPSSSDVSKKELPDVKSQKDAFKHFLEHLSDDKELEEVKSGDDIAVACHRIVHGGDYDRPVLLGAESLEYLKELTDLAPLHNAPALSLVHTTLEQLPKTRNIAFFDTTFHTLSMPQHIRTYPLDLEHARCNKIRKYGFHGISYSFIVREVAGYLQKPVEETSIIALHLGSGASACAIKNGKSVDNSMGLTPLEGLPGATRSGTVDPSLVFHYTNHASKLNHPDTDEDPRISKAEIILNKHSGWTALTGTSDFSTLVPTSSSRPPQADLAFNIFVDRILNYVGAYFVKLCGDVDALVFSGGVGEQSAALRAAVVEGVECLGFALQKRENEGASEKRDIVVGVGGEMVAGRGGPRVLVCRTDEAGEMVRECVAEGRFWKGL